MLSCISKTPLSRVAVVILFLIIGIFRNNQNETNHDNHTFKYVRFFK
jgi:hypothetical protein